MSAFEMICSHIYIQKGASQIYDPYKPIAKAGIFSFSLK